MVPITMCKHKNIFGKPGEGLHKYRMFNIAIVDTLLTIIAGLVIAKLFKTNVYLTIILLFLMSIIAHEMFCVKTTINKLLNGMS